MPLAISYSSLHAADAPPPPASQLAGHWLAAFHYMLSHEELLLKRVMRLQWCH